MKTLMLALAVLAALGTVPAMAGPNESCKGENCPKPTSDDNSK